MTFPHWISEDYLHAVISKDESISASAVDKLVDDIQTNKRTTTNHLLSSGYGDAVISKLMIWLHSASQRTAGNAAFILGSLAEDRHACLRIITNASAYISKGWRSLADTLVTMLNYTDNETILNAAGTLGTIAECDEGREWLLNNIGEFEKMLACLGSLLQSSNRWIASNAALVLARLSISDRGLQRILESPQSSCILENMINSLGTDEAGCGMNCAFTLGRVCDTTTGIELILNLPNKKRMLYAVKQMLATVPTSGPEWGVCKNACFCFSCLVATIKGNTWIVETPRLLNGDDYFFTCEGDDKQMKVECENQAGCILSSITRLLDMTNVETSWFAAMAVRSLISHPRGLIAVRRYQPVVAALKDCMSSPRASQELYDEVAVILKLLGPLQKAPKPKVLVYGQTSALVRWNAIDAPGQIPVTYLLYFKSDESDEPTLVYKGTNLETRVQDLQPYTRYTITLKGLTEVEEGPESEPTTLLTEEAIPPAPINLHAATVTTTQVRLAWNPPKKLNGILRYYLVRFECLEKRSVTPLSATPIARRKQQNLCLRNNEKTTEPTTIISGLIPQTLYSFSVCAVNGKGVGPSAVISVRTMGLGSHYPSKPSATILGRSEVMLNWEPPKVPLGRISRYEVYVNDSRSAAYAGTALSCRLTGLQPDTDYTFTVVLVTNKGKFESKSTKKRTAKAEYPCPPRTPLYELVSRRSRLAEPDTIMKQSPVIEVNAVSAESNKMTVPTVNDPQVKCYAWLNSLSMPNLADSVAPKEPDPHGDRANPVRTSSTPAMKLEEPIALRLARGSVTKPTMRPHRGAWDKQYHAIRRHHDSQEEELSLKRDLSQPANVNRPVRRAQSSISLRSNSGDRSSAFERVSHKDFRCPKPSASEAEKINKDSKSGPELPMWHPVKKTRSSKRIVIPRQQNPPTPVKRMSGFWRFTTEKAGNTKHAEEQPRSESAQSYKSTKPRRTSSSAHKKSTSTKQAHGLYLSSKKQLPIPFGRNFWNKRRPSTTEPVSITVINEKASHPKAVSKSISLDRGKLESLAEPPSIRLIPAGATVSGTQEISSSSSNTAKIRSPTPIEGIQAPIGWTRLNGRSLTLQTNPPVSPLGASAVCSSQKANDQ